MEQQTTLVLGLAGKGFRATLFHAGALWRLYDLNLFPSLSSVVSSGGGTLVAAQLAHAWDKCIPLNHVRDRDAFELEVVHPILRLTANVLRLPLAWRLKLLLPASGAVAPVPPAPRFTFASGPTPQCPWPLKTKAIPGYSQQDLSVNDVVRVCYEQGTSQDLILLSNADTSSGLPPQCCPIPMAAPLLSYWDMNTALAELPDIPEIGFGNELLELSSDYKPLARGIRRRLIDLGYAACAAALQGLMPADVLAPVDALPYGTAWTRFHAVADQSQAIAAGQRG